MKSVFVIAIVAVVMIGIMIPSSFADNITIVTVDESGFSQVCVDTGCYVPLIVTVGIGDTVTMTNTDPTGVHTFTSGMVDEVTPYPDGVFDSSVLMSGDAFEWVPTQSGEYLYYCMLHTWMVGLIEVQGSESPVESPNPISLVLILDPIPSSVTEGESIFFSGILMTSDGENVITDAEIQIKDDRTGISDLLIGVITTDENGEFYASWNAELRPTNGSYDFYAVFEDIDFGTQSERYSVNVNPNSLTITTTLVLDPIPSTVDPGDTVIFSGILMTSDGEIVLTDAPILIKDDRDLVADSIITTTITDQNGEFFVTWLATSRVNGSYDFYAVFEDIDFGSRSQTQSVVIFAPKPIIQSTQLQMNSIPSKVNVSDVIMISGVLTTDKGIPISDKKIELKDFAYHKNLPVPVVTDSKGNFSFTWIPEYHVTTYKLFVKFNGDENYRSSQSGYYGQYVDVEKRNSSITLDLIPSTAIPGSKIMFSGNLKLDGGDMGGQTIYIKDEDTLDTDDVLATAIVDRNGYFSTTWIVEERDADDRKTGSLLVELIDPTLVGAQKLNQILNAVEQGTVEIYAVFEEDSIFKKSDTCTTEYDQKKNRIYCKNNILVISGISSQDKVLNALLSDEFGTSGTNEEKLFSMLAGDEISNSEIKSLEEMLLESVPLAQQNFDNQEMSLEEILMLIEEPTSLEDSFEQIVSDNFDSVSNLEQELIGTLTPNVKQIEKIVEDSEITSSVIQQVKETTKISENIVEEISNEQGGGCLIATATYGSEMATEVQQLRELRDNTLLNTESGTAFMSTFNDVYYSFSPIIADMEREHPMFKEAVKLAITPMISTLSLMENAESESEVLSIGISVIMLNIGMYLGVPAVVIVGIRKRF